jgi:hypothetical protein
MEVAMAPQANSLHGRIPSGDQPPKQPDLIRYKSAGAMRERPKRSRYSIAELAAGLYCVIDRDGYAATDQDHADYLDAEAELAWLEAEDARAEAEASEPKRKIVTTHVYPPIPDRRCDWSAHYGGFEEGGPYGYGRTEQEAIADLRDNYDEPEGT